MPTEEIVKRITWDIDGDWYIVNVEVRNDHGQVATLAVRVSRSEVDRVARRIRERYLASAPRDANVGAWENLYGPGYQKVIRWVAGKLFARNLADQIRKHGVVSATPWFEPWSFATCDRAYDLISSAGEGDSVAKGQLDAIREAAEAGEPRAQYALAMFEAIAHFVEADLPRPSELARTGRRPETETIDIEFGAFAAARTAFRSPAMRTPMRSSVRMPTASMRPVGTSVRMRAPSIRPLSTSFRTLRDTRVPVTQPVAQVPQITLAPTTTTPFVKPFAPVAMRPITPRPSVPPRPTPPRPYGYPFPPWGMTPTAPGGGGGGGEGGPLPDFEEEPDVEFPEEGGEEDFPEGAVVDQGEYEEEQAQIRASQGEGGDNDVEPPPDEEEGIYPDEGKQAEGAPGMPTGI